MSNEEKVGDDIEGEGGSNPENQENTSDTSGSQDGKTKTVTFEGREFSVDEKYFDKDGNFNLEALLKSSVDMRQKLGKRGVEPIGDEYTVPEEFSIDQESALFKSVVSVAKDFDVPKAAMDALIKGYAEAQDLPGQHAKLQKMYGKNIDEKMSEIEAYWKSNIENGTVPPDAAEAFAVLSTSASGVRFLEHCMDIMKDPQVPDVSGSLGGNSYADATLEDLIDLKRSKEFQAGDPGVTKKASEMAKAIDLRNQKKA